MNRKIFVLGLIGIIVIILFFIRPLLGISFDVLFVIELIVGAIIGYFTYDWVNKE